MIEILWINDQAFMQRALSTEHEALTSTHKKRHVAYRVTVVSLNDQKQTIYKETSGNLRRYKGFVRFLTLCCRY